MVWDQVMGQYILRRLITLVPSLIGLSLILFAMVTFIPGDPARQVAGADATREEIEIVRQNLGLDQPVHTRYLTFLTGALQGDMGTSIRTRRPVSDEIVAHFPRTAILGVVALVISVTVGVSAGVVSAKMQNTIWDNLAVVGAMAGISVPIFWLGLLLMLLFGVVLGWLPTSGVGTPLHIILPAITLGLPSAAIVARQTRSAMLEVLRQDYIRTARSKGVRERNVVVQHALKNAAIPTVTIVGLQFGYLLGGSVIVESIFAWPGLGRLIIQSIHFRDLPVIQGGILFLAVIVVVMNLVVDITYGYLDPRIRYA